MDRVLIEGLQVEALVGVYAHERDAVQPLLLDIELGYDNRKPAVTDEVADTLDYAAVCARVRQLVAEAGEASAAGRLIIPPGDSAYDKYRAALAIDRDDAAARDGLAALPARAKELFAQALTDGAATRANSLLDAIRQIAPDDPDITAMTARLANAFLDQADARIGEGRREDASRAIDAARELSPDNPRIAPLDARLRALDRGRD